MRENMGLYRGKREDNKEWVEGSLLDREYIATITDTNGGFDSVVELICYGCKVDPATVGQFSGRIFSDRKAFEGDIFHILDEERDAMIVWDEHVSAFMAVGTHDGETIWLSDYAEDDMFWIGTKWDNPELLEAAP